MVETQMETWVLGNIIAGGLIGIVVDFSDGAAFRYDDHAMLAMQASLYGQGPVLSSNMRASDTSYQPLTRVYPPQNDATDPMVVAPPTPGADVTYRWRTAD